eukprot:XP_003391050.2 PREDICTED: uncharacterized protein LOC100638021 [Amphimedon queenslandica]
MLFITAGMGGGTGTGASPVIANIAREMGILTVAVVTRPFPFERNRRIRIADDGIRELAQNVDSMITIPNERLLKVLGEKVTLVDAFAAANDVLCGAVQGIADLITHTGMVNVDFADVRTVMSEKGPAMMGSGRASGPDRASQATDAAVRCPLLEDIDLSGARGILVNISARDDLSIQELNLVGDTIGEFASEDAMVIVGATLDESMGEDIAVTVVATGLIGEPLAMDRIAGAIPEAVESLKAEGWLEAAQAILTTDILPKGISLSKRIGGRQVRLTGIAKGSGMIHPSMATMLAFIATDAKVEAKALESALQRAVQRSFNRISVDGDTSTNDACVLAATGAAGNEPITLDSPEYAAFADLVDEATAFLAQAIVRDGEGATKFVEIEVIEGKDEKECLQVARTVAHSPLVKTALYAGDANWGRILAAVGRAGLPELDIARIRIWLGETCIVSLGARDPEYREEAGAAALAGQEIRIRIALGRGQAADRMWTCDFSHEYVSINADYRS